MRAHGIGHEANTSSDATAQKLGEKLRCACTKIALARSPCTIRGVSARRGLWVVVLGASFVCAVPVPHAHADALVTVQLKDGQGRPAEGKVTLLDAQNKPVASCQAQAGKCEMQNVPGGSFTVTVQPTQGDAPKPRKVMIPPSGKVALVVTAG
jgi:hypothetical protein